MAVFMLAKMASASTMLLEAMVVEWFGPAASLASAKRAVAISTKYSTDWT
jgi:hypothetical protein